MSPDKASIFLNWGTSTLYQAKSSREGVEFSELVKKSISLLGKARDMGSKPVYNLACAYAMIGNKEKALQYLEETLARKSISPDYVSADDDWLSFKEDERFKKLIEG